MNKIHLVSTRAITLNIFFKELITSLIKNKYNIVLWCSDIKNLKFDEVSKELILVKVNFFFFLNPFNFILAVIRLRRQIKNNKNDIFLINTPFISHLFRIASFGIQIKTIYFVHGFRFNNSSNFFNYSFHYLIEYLLSFFTHKYIVINNEDLFVAKKYFTKKLIKVNGVGIDLKHADSKYKKSKLEFNSINAIVISNYKKNKGYNDLMWIASKLQNQQITFDCFGYDNSDYFSKKISTLKLNNIKLNEFDPNLENKISKYDILVHLSYREGLPVSVMECLNNGVPVIGYDIRGMKDLIINNYNGYLFPLYHKEEVLIKLKNLIHNQHLLFELSTNSSNCLNISYSKDFINNQIINFITEHDD